MKQECEIKQGPSLKPHTHYKLTAKTPLLLSSTGEQQQRTNETQHTHERVMGMEETKTKRVRVFVLSTVLEREEREGGGGRRRERGHRMEPPRIFPLPSRLTLPVAVRWHTPLSFGVPSQLSPLASPCLRPHHHISHKGRQGRCDEEGGISAQEFPRGMRRMFM